MLRYSKQITLPCLPNRDEPSAMSQNKLSLFKSCFRQAFVHCKVKVIKAEIGTKDGSIAEMSLAMRFIRIWNRFARGVGKSLGHQVEEGLGCCKQSLVHHSGGSSEDQDADRNVATSVPETAQGNQPFTRRWARDILIFWQIIWR